jgi:hypothetical protein
MDFFQLATAQPARLQFKVVLNSSLELPSDQRIRSRPRSGKAKHNATSPYKINPNSIGNGREALLQFLGGESHNLLKSLACPTGIEPVTLSLEG